MIANTEEQIKALRAGGKILAGVLRDVAALCKDGVNTAELDLSTEHAIRLRGADLAAGTQNFYLFFRSRYHPVRGRKCKAFP